MERKKFLAMIIIIVVIVVVGAVLTLFLSDKASTMVVSFFGGQPRENRTQIQQPGQGLMQSPSGLQQENTIPQGESGGILQVEEDESMQEYAGQPMALNYVGGSVTECQTKWDCPDHKPCWSGMCKEPIMRTAKYQIFGGKLLYWWNWSSMDWVTATVPVPGYPVVTLVIAFRAKRADVDISEVNLPTSSISFAESMFKYLFEGKNLYDAIGIDKNDFELENGVLFKGGKNSGDQTRTGDNLLHCINLPVGNATKQGIGCIKQDVNNFYQAYFNGRTSVYFDGGPQGGAYFKYVPNDSTRWWNNFVYFVVAVAPMHPEGTP